MKKTIIGLAGLLIPLLAASPAGAWSHANARGGSTAHRRFGIHHAHQCGGRQRNAHVRSGHDSDRQPWRYRDAPGRVGADDRD